MENGKNEHRNLDFPACKTQKLVGELKIEFPDEDREKRWKELNWMFNETFVNATFTPKNCSVWNSKIIASFYKISRIYREFS